MIVPTPIMRRAKGKGIELQLAIVISLEPVS